MDKARNKNERFIYYLPVTTKMIYKYDLRITLRKEADTNLILKQYIARDVIFQNPIATGDRLDLGNNLIVDDFLSEPVVVYQSPEPNPQSVVHADMKVFDIDVFKFERIENKYHLREF